MRVLVTGGTGFIGSHTVAALRRRDHEVTVFARNPKAVAAALAPLGCSADAQQGDMTNPDDVARALEGCDAVVHAAAEIGVGGGSGPEGSSNLDGVRNVVGLAAEAEVESIVYTSSVSIYLPSTDDVITPDSPVADPLSPYAASKLEAERFVRGQQDSGAPVTSLAIGGVYGPVAPHLNGSFAAVMGALSGLMFVPPGGLGVVDVRDIAEMLASAAESPSGPRRFMAGGLFVSWAEWTEALSAASGVPIAAHEMSAEEMIDLGRQFDDRRLTGEEVPPLSEEAATIMTAGVPTDDSATLDTLGGSYRPTVETFRDTVDYLREAGHLDQP